MDCQCKKCGMSISGLNCGKCRTPLVKDKIKIDNQKEVQVAKCPKGCGKIKAPECCGTEMTCEA